MLTEPPPLSTYIWWFMSITCSRSILIIQSKISHKKEWKLRQLVLQPWDLILAASELWSWCNWHPWGPHANWCSRCMHQLVLWQHACITWHYALCMNHLALMQPASLGTRCRLHQFLLANRAKLANQAKMKESMVCYSLYLPTGTDHPNRPLTVSSFISESRHLLLSLVFWIFPLVLFVSLQLGWELSVFNPQWKRLFLSSSINSAAISRYLKFNWISPFPVFNRLTWWRLQSLVRAHLMVTGVQNISPGQGTKIFIETCVKCG